MGYGLEIWKNDILSTLKYISSSSDYKNLLLHNDFDGLTAEIFKNKYSFEIPSIDKNKEVTLTREILKYSLFVLLLRCYKKINNSNKQYFYKFYDLFANVGIHSIDADVIQKFVQSDSIEIPVNEYYIKMNGPYLKEGSDPNFTINYVIDEGVNLENYNLLPDIWHWYSSAESPKVNVIFPKNFKFNRPLDFASFSDSLPYASNLTIIFYAEKNENGDFCLPFEIQYLPEDKKYLDGLLKPIL